MTAYRYGPWDGTQEPFPLRQGDPFDRLAEILLAFGADPGRAAEAAGLDLEALEKRGLVERRGGRFALTAKGLRTLGHRALREIFGRLRGSPSGPHESESRGTGAPRYEESRPYEFGDDLANLDLAGTLRNALKRQGPRLPIGIEPDDARVFETDAKAAAATVCCLDLSGSMIRGWKHFYAKQVILALEAMIRIRFPGDTLDCVAFWSLAEPVPVARVPALVPKPVSMFDPRVFLRIPEGVWRDRRRRIPEHFTNIQGALRLARGILARRKAENRLVILITDGEPTAHFEGTDLVLAYPPADRTAEATLDEVRRCTRAGITINTFMLVDDFAYMGLRDFVGRMTRLNRGRAFVPTEENLGRYVLEDYVRRRRLEFRYPWVRPEEA